MWSAVAVTIFVDGNGSNGSNGSNPPTHLDHGADLVLPHGGIVEAALLLQGILQVLLGRDLLALVAQLEGEVTEHPQERREEVAELLAGVLRMKGVATQARSKTEETTMKDEKEKKAKKKKFGVRKCARTRGLRSTERKAKLSRIPRSLLSTSRGCAS